MILRHDTRVYAARLQRALGDRAPEFVPNAGVGPCGIWWAHETLPLVYLDTTFYEPLRNMLLTAFSLASKN
jgi:hypothetical protein